MEGWKTKKIKEIQKEITTGFACSKKHQTENGYVHLRTHNIGVDGNLNFDLKIKIDPDKVDQNKNILLKNDVIFNNTNSKELVGKTALVKRDYRYGFSNHLTRIRLNDDLIVPDYFVKYMVYLFGNRIFERMSKKWIGQAGINISMLKGIEVQFPSKAIQRDIVRKLNILFSEIDAALALIDENIEKAEALKLSVLDEEFGKIDLERVPFLKYIKERKEKMKPELEVEYNIIGLENIESYSGKLVDFKRRKGEENKSTKSVFEKDDILYSKLRPYLNKVYVAEFDGIASTEIIPFISDSEKFLNTFVGYYLRSESVVQLINLSCSGARMPRVKRSFWKELEIPMPSLEIQQKIVDKLDVLFTESDRLITEYQEKRANLEALKASLLHQAFTGKL